ncbi:MAG: phosphate acyltransferase PlsX [Clostridia bacterium]|nr:phosphate acyltransferase PlsX [Clostridia bacterium]
MRIVIDCFGGDLPPSEIVPFAFRAAEDEQVDIILVGDETVLKATIEEQKLASNRVSIVHAPNVITNDDDPATAVRHDPEASMSVALRLVKSGEGDAVISAGSTGALITGATLILRRMKGIRRAALAPVIPSSKGPYMLIDSGANAECAPEFLPQFAVMGSIYMKEMFGIERPRVGLINVGAEEKKGTEFLRTSHQLLKETDGINFIGNIEGRDAPLGAVDVAVCDGLVGNVLLKSMEGTMALVLGELKKAFKTNIISLIGAAITNPYLKKMKKTFDYKEYGGALFLGINGLVIKVHGSSNGKPFYAAVRQAKRFMESGINQKISTELEKTSKKVLEL